MTSHEGLPPVPIVRVRYFKSVARCVIDSFVYGLPLLQRELLVMSRRPRTFVLRAVFACTIFLVALIYASANSRTSFLTTAFGITGQGKYILDAVVWMLFLAVYLFGPAGACGALTEEKERDSLFLLYLSKLGPWQVVLEKYLSRLIPLFGMLLLSLPILAFSYAFGGITREMLGIAIWFLALSVFQVTSVAIMCSAICRSTSKSFLLTYFILLMISFGPDLFDHFVLHDAGWRALEKWEVASTTGVASYSFSKHYETVQTFGSGQLTNQLTTLTRPTYLNMFCAPILFTEYARELLLFNEQCRVDFSVLNYRLPLHWSPVTVAAMPLICSSVFCLLIARCLVFHRLFLHSQSGLLSVVGWLSLPGTMKPWAIHYSENRAGRLGNVPPEGQPIAWRESAKGFWGRPRPTCILVLLGEILTIWVILILTDAPVPSSQGISLLILSLWALSTLLVTVYSSLLITKERTRQTLDLLLTTPLTSPQIALQKYAGARRVILLCAFPLLTCVAFQSWWRCGLIPVFRSPNALPFEPFEYFFTGITCVALYLPLVAWTALWMGLKYPNPTRATVAAVMAIGAICILPAVIVIIPVMLLAPMQLFLGWNVVPLFLVQTSPVTMLVVLESVSLRQVCSVPYLPLILNVLIYGTILVFVRHKVLERAEFLLGRKMTY